MADSNKSRASHRMVQVPFTKEEEEALLEYMETTGERHKAAVVRRLTLQAIRKELAR